MRVTAPLLERPLVVSISPDARMAGDGCRGVLLGVKRACWVDVFDFASCAEGLNRLVESRFSSHEPWDAVGISLPEAQARRVLERLIEQLVPGDVLVTDEAVRFHAGDRWTRTKVRGPRR